MKFDKIKEILASKTIGIAGAGGLGSNCAAALVRCGLGSMVIADFDMVEEGNLNRQFYFLDQLGLPKVEALKINLLRINPNLNLRIFKIRLVPENIKEIFNRVDILVEAFDLAGQKEMLVETALVTWPGRPLVAASGLAGFGSLTDIMVRKYDELYICGDGRKETSPDNPPLAPRVGVVANMQADVVLEILLKTHLK